jgi:hypothetical protein
VVCKRIYLIHLSIESIDTEPETPTLSHLIKIFTTLVSLWENKLILNIPIDVLPSFYLPLQLYWILGRKRAELVVDVTSGKSSY